MFQESIILIIKWWRTLFVILIISPVVFSQTTSSTQYRFDSWTTDNGLPQASVNSILQTRDGFLWLTTFGGLVRYDGLRFEVFNSGNTEGLKTSRFVNLLEDKDGNLWITTEGQGITRYKDGVFTTYTTADGLSDNKFLRIDADREGNLLLEEHEQTLVWNGEKFAPLGAKNSEPSNILFRTRSGGIWHFEESRLRKTENGRVTVDLETGFDVYRVFEDSKGRVWIAGEKNRLFMFADGDLKSFSEKDGFPDARYRTAFEDREGAVWFGTPLGLIRYKNNQITSYTTADGLINDQVTTIYQDREGTMWVGTIKGLNRLTHRAVTAYSTADGLAADNVYPIFQDRAGRIWIGSWSGLTLYENGVFQNVSRKFGVTDDYITALTEDRDGNLWIGNWDGEIRRIKNGAAESFLQSDSAGNIKVIYEDTSGSLWFGTSENLLRLKDGILTTYTTADGLSGRQIFALREDRGGRLWIGTDAGLTVYQNDKFTPFESADKKPENIVRSIYEDADGTLWIGMYDSGLFRLKNDRVTHFTTNEGLFDNGAFQILEDDRENFWISFNLGIYRVKKSDLNDFADGRIAKIISIPYNKRDGMLNSECNGGATPAGIKASDGSLWFPTQKGAAVVNPDAVPFNPLPPPVVIGSLSIDTKNISPHSPVRIEAGTDQSGDTLFGLEFYQPRTRQIQIPARRFG